MCSSRSETTVSQARFDQTGRGVTFRVQGGLQFGTVGGSDAVCRSGLHRSSKAALAAQARVGNLGRDLGGALSQVGAGERRTHPARGIPAELQNSAVLSQSSARASTCAPARLSGFLIRLPETFSAWPMRSPPAAAAHRNPHRKRILPCSAEYDHSDLFLTACACACSVLSDHGQHERDARQGDHDGPQERRHARGLQAGIEGVRRREGVRHMEQLSAAVQRRNEHRGRGGGGAAAAAAAAEDAAEEGEGGGGVALVGRSVGRRHHADPHRHAPGAHSHRAPGTRAAMRAALAAASPAGLAAAARAEE